VTSTTGVTIFDPNPITGSGLTTGKNNLGTLNAVAFFGLNQFKLSALTSVDIQVSVLYSYTTYITTTGATVNSYATSYYFY
jgi:hypothetical protein